MSQKKHFFDYVTEIIGWISIAFSPILISCLLGLLIYGFQPNQIGIAIACLLLMIGFIIGISWATSIWKKEGTIHFISTLFSATSSQKREDAEQ